MQQLPLYQVIARTMNARANCIQSGNAEWKDRHEGRIESLVKEHMPRGCGFDVGTLIDWDKSTENRLVFTTEFHHMDENGSYDGWSQHDVIIQPDLGFGYNLRITGVDRNDIKDYIADVFRTTLDTMVDEYEPKVP